MSNQAISINTLNPIAYNNIPVLTTELLANLYETESIRIQQNHARNSDRFIEGKHYFKVYGAELKNLRLSLSELQISPKTRSLILWTERGAARHAKMLDTDQAWEVFEKLEDSYFNSSEQTGRYDTNQESLINSHSYRHESHLALNTFYDACKAELDKAGIKVPNLPRPDNKVLDGLISGMLMSSRFLLSFDYKLKATISQVPMNACVVDTKNKTDMSTIMQEFVPIELIPDLMTIGLKRLSRRIN